MHLRIPRDRFNNVADVIVSAASHESVGAPMIYSPSGDHLRVVYLSGSQLSRLYDRLQQVTHEDPSLGGKDEIVELMEETYKCSNLFVVSTTEELQLISDRSRWQYDLVEELYKYLMPLYVEFRGGCNHFVRDLARLRI